jgi:hypothetical protein
VNYAWRSLEEVSYDRCAPGGTVRVVVPNSAEAPAELPTEKLLKTRALDKPRTVLSHCAHYYFNRTCNMGPDCQFVHAVFIDPTAKLHQRAPPPFQMQRKETGSQVIETEDQASLFRNSVSSELTPHQDISKSIPSTGDVCSIIVTLQDESSDDSTESPVSSPDLQNFLQPADVASASHRSTPSLIELATPRREDRVWVRRNPYSLTDVLCVCRPAS